MTRLSGNGASNLLSANYGVTSTAAGAITGYDDHQYVQAAAGSTTQAEAGTSVVAGVGQISWSR